MAIEMKLRWYNSSFIWVCVFLFHWKWIEFGVTHMGFVQGTWIWRLDFYYFDHGQWSFCLELKTPRNFNGFLFEILASFQSDKNLKWEYGVVDFKKMSGGERNWNGMIPLYLGLVLFIYLFYFIFQWKWIEFDVIHWVLYKGLGLDRLDFHCFNYDQWLCPLELILLEISMCLFEF